MMIGTEAADGAGRCAYDSAGFAIPRALAVWAGCDINRIFQSRRYRAIVLRGDEEDSIGSADSLTKCSPVVRGIYVPVLII